MIAANFKSRFARPRVLRWPRRVTIAERIARDIRALPGVTATLTSVGIGSASFTGSSAGAANQRFHLREAGAARAIARTRRIK